VSHGGIGADSARCRVCPVSFERVLPKLPPVCERLKEDSPLKLFSCHAVVAGQCPELNERVVRWVVMPVKAPTLKEAVENAEFREMCLRAAEGLCAPIVIQRQAYDEMGWVL